MLLRTFVKRGICVLGIVSACFLTYSLYFRYGHRPDLTVCGSIDFADGIGRQSLELMDIFKDELSISFIPTRSSKFADVPDNLKKIASAKRNRFGKVIIFEDLIWWPKEEKYRKIVSPAAESSVKIAYSMFESTQIPPEWVIILNQYFDAVIVPDKFLVTVYQESGVNIPVFVIPLGLNLQPMLNQPLKQKRHHPLVFGNLAACSDRKNQLLLVRAFAKAFGNNPDVCLRINCRGGERDVSNAITKEITTLGLKNVQFTQFSLNREEYLRLFQEIDCLVNISKSEGFSIQTREAMALGIPVIATRNTAQETVCESRLIRSIDCPFKEPFISPWGDSYGFAFNCTVDAVVDALYDVYFNYDHYLQNGPLARKWASQYQYENLRPLYKSFVRPRQISLGQENVVTEKGLITTSEKLIQKYRYR